MLKTTLLKSFRELIEILDKEKIWYSCTLGTLLGAWKFNGFIPWDDDIDIFIKKEGYIKLKQKYPHRVVDFETPGYPLLLPKWRGGENSIHDSTNFIDLFVIVETTDEKIKNWQRFSNKIRFGVYATHTNYKPHSTPLKILKFSLWPLKFFFKKNVDYIKEINDMEVKGGGQYYYAVNPVQTDRWSKLPSFFNFKLTKLEFEGIEVCAIKDYKKWLTHRYGGINMKPPIGKRIEVHTNAYNVKYKEYDGKKILL